jgi:hypothetical protein
MGAESVTAWANESFEIVRWPDVGCCVQTSGGCWRRDVPVNEGYIAARDHPWVRERLKAPAVRLAAILNEALAVGL